MNGKPTGDRMYHQNYDPFGNAFLSTLVAAVPILSLLERGGHRDHRAPAGLRVPGVIPVPPVE